MSKIYELSNLSTAALRERKGELLSRLTVPEDLLRGSYVERFTTCGKPNCGCTRGDKHGPFYYLVIGLVAGKVRKFLLKSTSQRERAERGVRRYHEFREGLEELSQINAELLRRDESLLS